MLPGAIDAHVHSRDPGFPEKEDWGTLTAAAAAGGVTTVVDMPNTRPATGDAELLAAKATRAASLAHVDFGLWGLLRAGSTAADLDGLLDAGVTGLKAYLGYAYRRSDRSVTYTAVLDDPDLEPPPSYEDVARAATLLARRGALLAVHGEDPDVLRARARRLGSYDDVLAARPAEAEAVAIARVGEIAVRTGVRVHAVHVSSREGLEAALAARRAGADISIETCPQYLWATAADYARVGNALRMNPPVRLESDRDALRRALVAGDIDTIGTDHAPHTDEEKFGASLDACHPGSPGVQTLLLSTLELGRRLGAVDTAIRAVSSNVAGRLRFAGKGSLEPGADADLVLVDPSAETTFRAPDMRSRQAHGVLEGLTVGFAIRAVHVRGEQPAHGRFVRPS